MTTPAPLTPETAPAPAPLASTAAETSNPVGLIGFILSLVGFLFAIIPPTSFIAWLVLLPAVVLAIVGLALKGRKKAFALTALIVGLVGWLIAIIVAVSTVVVGVGTAIDGPDDLGTEIIDEGTVDDASGDAGPTEAAIGDTVANDEGVAFTVNSIKCGIKKVGESFLEEKAKGQFCRVKFTLDNGATDAEYISSSDFTAFIGDAEYDAESGVSKFGDDHFGTDVNPGLSIDGVVYFDIPADGELDYVQFRPLFGFDPVTIKVA